MLNNSTIHFDEFVEKKVLGMLFVSKEKKYFEEAKNLLNEKCFHSYANKLVYNALMQYYETNKDIFIIEYQDLVNYVLSTIQSSYSDINMDYIHNLVINACRFENRFQHFQCLNRLSALREIENNLEVMLYKVRTDENTNIENFVSLIQKKMSDASEKIKINEYKTIKDISDNYFNDLMNKRMTKENNIFGVPTGYDVLDKNTQGFKGGELIVIAARPAMGKTAFALNIATNAARNSKKVLFFSLEMSEFQLMSRIYSSITEIDASKLKRPQFISNEELRLIAAAKQNVIDKISLFIDDSTSSKLEDIVFKARKVKKTTGLDLIIVDYLQLISDETKGQNRQNEVAKISRTLKQLARELDVPVIALSQLSRSVESREDKRPLLSDLRESGAIEQDADMVVFLYRDDYYNKNKKNSSFEQDQSIGSIVEVIIAKYRSGATDNKKLRFQMNISRFSEIPYIK
uniref:Replicative DNA helicase n=1 Tax=Mycoplasma anserisalpingitidis TaxID=519450 RepID=A0A8F2DEU0_9MOLU|nr:replicative DNA helicase [Mycoplasma anserisalpingitidis]